MRVDQRMVYAARAGAIRDVVKVTVGITHLLIDRWRDDVIPDLKANLFDILRHHVLARRAGELFDAPLDCILSQTTIVQPDIVFVAREHAGRVSPCGIEGSPTLAGEVISPSTERIDRRRKLELYACHLLEHYWIVDPVARTIEAHTLTGQRYRLSGRLEGPSPTALDPFLDLLVDPAALWA